MTAPITFKHIHSSSRFDRTVGVFEDAVHAYEAEADIVTYTEMTNSARDAVFDDPDWEYWHNDGPAGTTECAMEWRTSKFTAVGDPDVHAITDMTFTRSEEYGGGTAPPVRAFKQTLESTETGLRVAVIVTHMPLENTPLRQEIWLDCAKGLVAYIRNIRKNNPGIKILLVADWNRNWREADERALIQTHIAGPLNLKQSWDGHAPNKGGTHGPRSLIDGNLSDLPIVTGYLFKDDESSDHRPYLFKYGLGEGSPVPAYAEKTQIEIQRLINILDKPDNDDDLLKIFTFNVKRDHGAAEVIADINKGIKKTNADLVGLQEAWQYVEEIDDEFTGGEFRVIHPTTGDSGDDLRVAAVTVLVRKSSFTDVTAVAWKGCDAAGDQPSRWVIMVTATHVGSGRTIKYINTHMNAGVQPFGSNVGNPEVAAYRNHIESILERIEAADDETPFFLSGDWNVTWPNKRPVQFWPMKAFGRNGFVANWSYDKGNNPTTSLKGHGSLLDQVYHRRMSYVRFKGDKLIPNDNSDHFGLMSAYGILKNTGAQSDE